MASIRIVDLQKVRGVNQAGTKAANLHWMLQHRYKIPTTYVLQFVKEPDLLNEATLDEIRVNVEKMLEPDQPYAVRSSANLEDTQQHSYAGQFKTFLNLSGVQEVVNAIMDVLRAGDSEMVKAYASKSGQDTSKLQIAVIIQKMVSPVVSGVAFSKNPLTGLDEVIVEAVPGSGEALVQEGKTPDRWVFKWGECIFRPDESNIKFHLIQQVVSQTSQISQSYGRPVDLEWVYDGKELYWVQLRPITHLDEVNIYSNRISKEVFPGIIKPLVWSVNVPLVNSAWIRLFTQLIGRNDLHPDELARSFAYQAYFNMGVIGRIFTLLGFPKESLELLLGFQGGEDRPRFRPSSRTMRYLPRMLVFGAGLMGMSSKIMPAVEKFRFEYAALLKKPLDELDEKSILEHIDRLFQINQQAAYFNIVVPLLMSLYNLLLRRQLSKIRIDFSKFDLTHGLSELSEYDPSLHLSRLASQYSLLDDQARAMLMENASQDAFSWPGMQAFQNDLTDFINHFGHLSDSGNDFSSVPWRENPSLVLQMIQAEAELYKGAEPYSESSPISLAGDSVRISSGTSDQKVTWETLKLNSMQRLGFRPIYQNARRYRLYREAVSSIYTYGYGQFRVYFLELGRRFVTFGFLAQPEDIFYLHWNEVKALIHEKIAQTEAGTSCDPVQLTAQRKREMESSRDLILPEIIYGDDLPPIQDPDKPGDIRYGIPSSGGYYRGPVKVINRIAEFGKLQPGDVLVIPYSDVSWTPLFTRAGAVIAESGGILSHSSIVAREYRIPAVVSVAGAMRLRDEQIVTVDGYRGEVILHD
jgi:phosphohistidine swiveling domain-containing protein